MPLREVAIPTWIIASCCVLLILALGRLETSTCKTHYRIIMKRLVVQQETKHAQRGQRTCHMAQQQSPALRMRERTDREMQDTPGLGNPAKEDAPSLGKNSLLARAMMSPSGNPYSASFALVTLLNSAGFRCRLPSTWATRSTLHLGKPAAASSIRTQSDFESACSASLSARRTKNLLELREQLLQE